MSHKFLLLLGTAVAAADVGSEQNKCPFCVCHGIDAV